MVAKHLVKKLKAPLPNAIERGAMKLRWHRLVGRGLKGKPSTVRLLGFDVQFLHWGNLALLYDEIFIQRSYCFKADSETPLILDCGSNIGMSILFFKRRYPEARVIGFEASEGAYEVLKRNVEANHLHDVAVHHRVLKGEAGHCTFYVAPDNAGALSNSTFQERMAGRSTEVEMTPLSPYIDEPVDFLKMDIEGAEMEVLEELAERGKLRWIRQMIVEYHHHLMPEQDDLSKLLSLLESNGFGYQIRHGSGHGFGCPPRKAAFQDLLIYAYQKPQRSSIPK